MYVAVLAPPERGGVRLGELEEIGYQLGDTAVSVGWRRRHLLVGTRANDARCGAWRWMGRWPGRIRAQHRGPGGGGGVRGTGVAATDGRALVMLNRDDSDPKYWREVPGLVGRAIPVVAH